MGFVNLKTAERLVDLGTDVNHRDQWGYSVLAYAVQRNYHSVIRKLVRRGADHTAQLNGDGSFLHVAAANADVEMLRILANARLAIRDIHQKRRDGLTATDVAKGRTGVGRQWREAFRDFLISVTEIRVFGPEEDLGDSDSDAYEDAVERQL